MCYNSQQMLVCYNGLKVRAVKTGTVLVVDEADKAPTHVTCILKNLVENSEITLADGRRIVPCTSLTIIIKLNSLKHVLYRSSSSE